MQVEESTLWTEASPKSLVFEDKYLIAAVGFPEE